MAKPYLCPVCQGRGVVPAGFYGLGNLTSSLTPEQCRTCSGFGIVWDYTSDGPGCGYIGPHIPQDIHKTVTLPPNGTIMKADLGKTK